MSGAREPAKLPAKLPADQMLTIGGNVADKIDMYGWEMVDKCGRFQKVSKRELHIDPGYQREHVKHARVNRIASRWSWVRFGALSVARRPDGSLWVFDGQHRKLAADKRSDVDELPCMVFTATGAVDESKFFLDVNCDRGTVAMIDRFKALLAQKDPVAEEVTRMVAATGYKISRGGADFTVQCAGALYRMTKADGEAAAVAWQVAAEMYAGKPVLDRVFSGLWGAERHIRRSGLGSIARPPFSAALVKLTPTKICRSIAATGEYHGAGGPKTQAEGVIRLLNHGRRTNLVPSLYTGAASDEAGE